MSTIILLKFPFLSSVIHSICTLIEAYQDQVNVLSCGNKEIIYIFWSESFERDRVVWACVRSDCVCGREVAVPGSE